MVHVYNKVMARKERDVRRQSFQIKSIYKVVIQNYYRELQRFHLVPKGLEIYVSAQESWHLIARGHELSLVEGEENGF